MVPLRRKDIEDLEAQDADRRRRLENPSPDEEESAALATAAAEAMINRSVFISDEEQRIEYLQNCIRSQALTIRVAIREYIKLKQELQETNGHLITTERLVAWAALICGGIGLVAGWLGCLVKVKGW